MSEKGTVTLLSMSRLGPGSTSALAQGGTILGLGRAQQLSLTAIGSYNAAGSALRIHLVTSPDNSSWDTGTFYGWDNPLTVSARTQKTKAVDYSPMFMKAKVQNLAVGTPIRNVKVIATRQIG